MVAVKNLCDGGQRQRGDLANDINTDVTGVGDCQDRIIVIPHEYEGLTVKEIADRSFISEVYFRKLFKAEFGMSPQKYIIKQRMQKAVFLMSTGYYSLKEIALMSGYTDYKYFSTEFKREKGVSPSKFVYNF